MEITMKQYDFDEIIPRENTDCVKYDLRKIFFDTEDVLPMWVADMDFRTPDFVIEALSRRLGHEILGYTLRGKEFNEAIIGWNKKRHGWNIHEKHIVFSPGVVPAVNMLVLSLTNPGDKIIIQPPVYYPFFTAVEKNHRTLVENPLRLHNGRLCMNFDDLRQKAKGATMMIISHPHNPGGSLWTKDELLQLTEICLENNVIIVSDEIHSDLVFAPGKHIPPAGISPEIASQTITCNAPSKTFNLAGLATSYLIISNTEYRKKYNELLNDQLHVGMGNIFGPIALQAVYRHGDEWLRQLLAYVWENVQYVKSFCEKHIPKIKVIVPEATYMIWLDCRELALEGDALKDFFIKKAKLGLNDGKTFGTGGEGFMRMNVAAPRRVVEEAMNRIKKAIE
jgi:cysteine-S-conjugate beta-lyase